MAVHIAVEWVFTTPGGPSTDEIERQKLYSNRSAGRAS
jgi:hypothetical protein